MASRLVTPAEDPAVTLTEAKAWLRVDTSDDDTLIGELLMTAQKFLEDRAGISIMYQEWETLFDGFPAGELSLIRPPLFWDGGVPKLLNVNYFDVDGEEQLLAAANYQVRDYVRKIALVPAVGLDWPDTEDDRTDAVFIQYATGYETAALVPLPIKQAIKMLVAHWYANRETVLTGTISKQLEFAVDALMSNERIHCF